MHPLPALRLAVALLLLLATLGSVAAQPPGTPPGGAPRNGPPGGGPPGGGPPRGGPPGGGPPSSNAPPPTATNEPAPQIERGPPPPPALEVQTSSLLQHRIGEWTTIDVRATNPTSEPVEALVTVLFQGGKRQYARRIWVPAKGDRSTWLPIQVPADAPTEGGLEYTALVLDANAEGEVLTRRSTGELTSSAILRISTDPVRSTVILPRKSLSPTPTDEAFRREWQAALAAARTTRSLNPTSPLMVPDFLPPWHGTLRGFDAILLASDRMENDTEGLSTLRNWVRDGGRLWLPLDAVRPETVEAILGSDAGIEVVDRVEIDAFTIATNDRETRLESTDSFDLEEPVEMVRVVTSHPDVAARVDGWPAAIWVPCGKGDVLLTTLGPRAWVGPDGTSPTGGSRALAARLLAGRPDRLDVNRLRPALERQIGYATPSRGVAATILGLFCAALLGAGWFWSGRQRLDNLAWFVPAAGLSAAALLGLVGVAQSRQVEPTVAEARVLRVDPATGEAIVDGVAAVFDRESRPVAWTGRQRTWVIPEAAAGTNGERVTWLDDQVETTTNTSTHAGAVDRLSIRGESTIVPGVAVRGRFGPAGIEGRLDGGPLAAIRDPAIVGLPGPALAVDLAADGTFTAAAEGLMAAGQYNPATLLSDDARWRQDATRRLLQSPEDWLRESGRPKAQAPAGIAGALALRRRPWMLFWCESPGGSGWDLPEGFVERRSDLVLMPLTIERTPSGSPFRIPSGFLPARLGDGTQGRSNAFDVRRGEWVKGLTTPTETLLRFRLPDSVLPCTLDSGRLVLRVNAPSRELEVRGERDGQPVTLARIAEPNGVYEVELGAAELRTDDGDSVPITIVISPTLAEREAAAKGADDAFSAAMSDTNLSSTWEIEYVRLTVDGHTR